MNLNHRRTFTDDSAPTCIAEASCSTEEKQTAEFQTTTQVPQLRGYTDLSIIGRGASSVVYSALDRRTQQRVALKQLRTGLDHDASSIKDFLNEGRLLMGMRHHQIIRCFDFFFESGSYWIVLEEVTSGSLKDCSCREIQSNEMPVCAGMAGTDH